MLQWPLTIKLFSWLLHNCNFAAVMNCNKNIWYTGYLICDPYEKVIWPLKGSWPIGWEPPCWSLPTLSLRFLFTAWSSASKWGADACDAYQSMLLPTLQKETPIRRLHLETSLNSKVKPYFKNSSITPVRWHAPSVSAPGRQRQSRFWEFEAILVYIVSSRAGRATGRPCLKNTK